MKVNSMGVLIREWKITVQLVNPKYGDYTELSTTIYHTNEAMAKVAGVKKLEDRLGITIEEEDWGYTTTALEVG
jgi:hypothetical protein